MSRSRQYDDAVRSAADCVHEQQGGDLVRPWTGTPACPLCRRRHPVHWRRLPDPADKRPAASVTPIAGTRALFAVPAATRAWPAGPPPRAG